MNIDIERFSEELAPTMDHRDSSEMSHVYTGRAPAGANLLGTFLPSLLKQAKGGLSAMPQATLHDSLQPVVNALRKLDAELLLDLEITDHGPRVREG